MNVGLMLMVAGLLAAAPVDNADLLNAAARDAVDAAQVSLVQAAKVGPVVKRIAVANLEGDKAQVTALLRTALTKTSFDVVLTQDADWAPLLDEFARQVRREDIMAKDTAHQLRVQGVDAVVFGTVEKASVEPVREGGLGGQQATVRLLLNLASLSEENPGSVLWSEQVAGAAKDLQPLTGTARLVAFVQDHTILALVVAAVLLVAILTWLFRRAATPR